MHKRDPLPEIPRSDEAERAVLATILQSEAASLQAWQLVRPGYFYLPANRLIFEAAQRVSAEGAQADLITVVEELGRLGKLDEAGGAACVAALLDPLERATNLQHYTEILREKAQLRALMKFSDDLDKRVLRHDADASEILERSVGELLRIASDGDAPARARPWKQVADSAIRALEAERASPQRSRLFFGLRDLDELTSGLRRRELVLIVAPTSNGKTLLAQQLAAQADSDGFRALFFSAEMPGEQLALRELAWRAGLPFYWVRRPEKLRDDQLDQLRAAATEPCDIHIVDRDITPARVWMAEAAKRSAGLDLVVVDYDQLVIEAGMNPNSQDEESIFRHQRNFILQAKRLTERLDLCFVLVAQLRKLPAKILQGDSPRLDDIWGDSSMRNTPHTILWVTREFFRHGMDVRFERKARVWILKARNDRTGVMDLEFNPERLRFLDAPPSEADSTEEATDERARPHVIGKADEASEPALPYRDD